MTLGFHALHIKMFGKDELHSLVSEPLWYTRIEEFALSRKLGAAAVTSTLAMKRISDAVRDSRERLYDQFEDLLEDNSVYLGSRGDDLYEWDSEREPINAIVIHHSARPKGLSLSRLSAMELLRLYVPAYTHPAPDDAPRVKNKPIYSGHFAKGHQRFFPYHWIIRQDGTGERLLADDQIGWHCGNWAVNKRSVAICFDDDLAHATPNEAMLAEARRIITNEYGWLQPSSKTIHPHSEYSDTACPGDAFGGKDGWKRFLTEGQGS